LVENPGRGVNVVTYVCFSAGFFLKGTEPICAELAGGIGGIGGVHIFGGLYQTGNVPVFNCKLKRDLRERSGNVFGLANRGEWLLAMAALSE